MEKLEKCEVRDDCHFYVEGLCQWSEMHLAFIPCSHRADLLKQKGQKPNEEPLPKNLA